MNKRGVYFFVIDAFIGGAVVLVSLFVVLNSYTARAEQDRPITILEDYVTYFQNTEVRDFSGSTVMEMVADGNITELDNSLFDQVAEFHFKGELDQARLFVEEISLASLPTQMSLRFYYGGDLMYDNEKFPYQEATQVLSTKKLSMVTINNSFLYGPRVVEVVIWSS